MPASNGRWLTRDSRQAVIGASPDRIYGLVCDLPRMGEWSPECERVEWTGGTTVAAAGDRFAAATREFAPGLRRRHCSDNVSTPQPKSI
jgi:hypothetical protein